MASILTTAGAGFSCHTASSKGGLRLKQNKGARFISSTFGATRRPSDTLVLKAQGEGINPDIKKSEEKVVDSVVITELSKPLTAYCSVLYPDDQESGTKVVGVNCNNCPEYVGGPGLFPFAMGAM